MKTIMLWIVMLCVLMTVGCDGSSNNDEETTTDDSDGTGGTDGTDSNEEGTDSTTDENETESEDAGDPDGTTSDDSCVDVSCSSHGTCEVEDGEAVCICDEGYTASGLECVATPEEVTVTGMEVENGAVVSASETFVQEALSTIVSTTGASMTDAVVDSELSGAAIIYNKCPLIYTDGAQVRKMFADFNVCACRNMGLRGAAYVERESGGITLTFLKDNNDADYALPIGEIDQWSEDCEAEGEPLGDAPEDEDEWARFQAGSYYLSGQVSLNRITNLKDMVHGTIGYGFSTADDMPLTFEQAIMPDTDNIEQGEHVYYISEPITFSVPEEFNTSLILKGLDSDDLVIPDFYVYFKGQLEVDGQLSVVAGGPDEVPPIEWEKLDIEDPTLSLLCSEPLRDTPDCDDDLTSGQMAFDVNLGGVTIQVPASSPDRVQILGHHIGGEVEECYTEEGNENTCVCPNEGMSFEMVMPYLTVGIINPVLSINTEGTDTESDTEEDTEDDTEEEVPALQVFGRFEVSINFGFGFEITKRACESPDAIDMFYLGQDVINTDISYEDLYCAFNQTLYMFCAQEDPTQWEDEIYFTWAAREYYLDEWNDKGGEDSLTIDIDGEALVEMLNNLAICNNLCRVPECTLEENDWVDPAFCDYVYMLPFGTCEGVTCDEDQICNPITDSCVDCITDKECPEETPFCTNRGECIECEDDEDCEEGECKSDECKDSPCGDCEFKCREETICPECVTSEDCGDDEVCCNQLCDDAFKYKCVECYNKDHCDGDPCDMNTYTCIDGGGCQNDDACSGSTPACDTETGECVACTAENDTVCADKDKVCEPESHQCVECLTGDDCSAGAPVCKSAEESRPYTCVQCTSDDDCNTTCNTTVNRCDCGSASDCPDPENQKCQMKVCSQ